jgi:hypothetical protein
MWRRARRSLLAERTQVGSKYPVNASHGLGTVSERAKMCGRERREEKRGGRRRRKDVEGGGGEKTWREAAVRYSVYSE